MNDGKLNATKSLDDEQLDAICGAGSAHADAWAGAGAQKLLGEEPIYYVRSNTKSIMFETFNCPT